MAKTKKEEIKKEKETVTEVKQKEIKSISPLISQIALRVFGSYCSTHTGNDVYYLVKAIYILISDLGEENVKKEWELKGKNYNWKKTKKLLVKLDKKSTEVKAFYDNFEDKRGERKGKEMEIKRYYAKTASKVPMLIPEIYELMIFLIKETSIQRQTISSEAFKILEHSQYRKIDLSKRPMSSNTNTQPSSGGQTG
jgi:hypothetical protein